MAINISTACIGCEVCVDVCPVNAIEMVTGQAAVIKNKCIECKKCVKVCPVAAITLPEKDGKATALKTDTTDQSKKELIVARPSIEACPELADFQGVWIFIEQLEGKVASVSYELLGAGRELADKLGVELAGVLFGHNIDSLIPSIFNYGADKVYVIDDIVFEKYRTETYRQAFTHVAKKYKPEIVLLGATTTGRDLAGAVGTDLLTGLTADCTELDIDLYKRLLLASRPAFGGNIMATILCEKNRPQMASVRPKVMPMPEKTAKTGEIVYETIDLKEEDLLTKVIAYVKDAGEQLRLDEAEIIVAGGKGMSDQAGFQLIEDLANVLGGKVGATRAAIEAGWISHKHQIGQTGITVAPKLYFAIGISGAIQHVVGMTRAETIIAINVDAEASIFKEATYGIVGDAHEILPKIIAELKKSLNKKKIG